MVLIVRLEEVFVAIVSYSVLPFSNVAIVSPLSDVIDQLYENAVAFESVTVTLLPPLTFVEDAVSLGLLDEVEEPEDELL